MKKKIWFRAKNYGYGWYPCTWQGWLVILVWAIIFLFGLTNLDHESGKNFFFIFLATVLLIYISYKKGEKARWRWGKLANSQ